MRIRARRRCVRLLRCGNDRKVATIVSGTYPTVLSQFTITNTITTTIIASISSRGSTDELASAYDPEDEAANDSDPEDRTTSKSCLGKVGTIPFCERWHDRKAETIVKRERGHDRKVETIVKRERWHEPTVETIVNCERKVAS